jgi:hypothetical protein
MSQVKELQSPVLASLKNCQTGASLTHLNLFPTTPHNRMAILNLPINVQCDTFDFKERHGGTVEMKDPQTHSDAQHAYTSVTGGNSCYPCHNSQPKYGRDCLRTT